jgi:hypothetical protein
MDKREMLVKMVIKQTCNSTIGGYENSVSDGLIKEMPSHEALIEQIYFEVMKEDRVETSIGMISVKKDLRFIGAERIKQYINKKIEKMGY